MKQCLIVSDSFKGSLSSQEVCRLAEERIVHHFPACRVRGIPVADGGEGTVDCFLAALPGGQRIELEVPGPFGQPVPAFYGRFGTLAVVEMAAAAGLPLADGRLNPETASTSGVGALLRHAVENGAEKLVLALGGSCTNDAGCGCAAALGARFYNEAGEAFVPVGGSLREVCRYDVAPVRALLKGVEVLAMCDVENPLYGPQGAAHVYGPQKGADEQMVQRLDEGLRQLGGLLDAEIPGLSEMPGAGAAGGFGAGVVAFLGGRLQAGIDTVLDMVGFDELLHGCNCVFTGEGRLDSQSLQGKVVGGVAARARAAGVPVVAVCGDIAPGEEAAFAAGVTAVFSINRVAVPFAQAKLRSAEDLSRTYDNICRLLKMKTPAL